MKTILFFFLFSISFISYSQSGSGSSTTSSGQPVYLSSDSNYAKFAEKNFVTLDYTIIEQGKERKVVLINSAGKLVKSQLLVNSRDQVVVKLDNLPQGNYVCFILVDGKSIGSKQLTVIK